MHKEMTNQDTQGDFQKIIERRRVKENEIKNERVAVKKT